MHRLLGRKLSVLFSFPLDDIDDVDVSDLGERVNEEDASRMDEVGERDAFVLWWLWLSMVGTNEV